MQCMCVCTMQNERQTCIHRHCVLEVYTRAGCTCNDHLRTIALVLILQHAYPRKVVHDGYQLITISVPFEVGRPPIPLVLCLFTGTRTCLCTWAMLRKSRIMYMYMKVHVHVWYMYMYVRWINLRSAHSQVTAHCLRPAVATKSPLHTVKWQFIVYVWPSQQKMDAYFYFPLINKIKYI